MPELEEDILGDVVGRCRTAQPSSKAVDSAMVLAVRVGERDLIMVRARTGIIDAAGLRTGKQVIDAVNDALPG